MEKPKKKIEVSDQRSYPFTYVSNKVSFDVFLDWVRDVVPNKATDVTISLENEYDEGNDFYYIVIGWKEKIDNVNYDFQMKEYKKQLGLKNH